MRAFCGDGSHTARITLFAYLLAILITVAPATLYVLIEIRHIRDDSLQYSQLLAERLQQAIAENPQLWQFAIPKFIEITRHRQWFPDIVDVVVYDTDSRLIHTEEPTAPTTALSFSTQHELQYKGESYGFLRVQNRLDEVLYWAALILLLGGVVGAAVGYGIYVYSIRNIQQAEQAKRNAIDNLAQANDCLEDMSVHDVATGVYTISYVSNLLMQAFADPTGPVSVLLLDIDFFRNYNDLHGHESGNGILVEMSDVLRQHLRDQDIIGRFGGEEFIIVLPETEVTQAAMVADRIRVAVEAHNFPGAEFQPKGRLTVSIGLSSTETAATFQEMFRQLDDALYKAKSSGRNFACAFSLPEGDDEPLNLTMQSPEMKAEVTRKFISRFFHGSSDVLPQLHEPTILAFLKALEIWDPGTIQHSLRVNKIAMEIARAMKLPKADSLTLNLGTLLHDIGKLTIGDTILIKPGQLTEDEYELMKNHPRVGYDLVKNDPVLHKAADIVFMHHERFDGTGYPSGLAGKQIPLLARICAIADAIDAMMTDRPYSKGKSAEEVRQEIAKNKGRQFDPEIAEVVLAFDWQLFHHSPVINFGSVVPGTDPA